MSSSDSDSGTARTGTVLTGVFTRAGVITTNNEATASTGPTVNSNESIVEAIREAVNDYSLRKKAACADGEDWKNVAGARTRELTEEESARFTKAFDENMEASEDLAADSDTESGDALCAMAAELCSKEPEACCKKTVDEEAKDASVNTKATDEAVTTAVDGAAEVEIQGTLSTSQTLLPASVAWWKKRESIVDFAANYGNNQAGNEATTSPAVEEEEKEAKDLPPAYVEEKAVEAVSSEVVAAIQKIEDLAISEEEDMSVKEVTTSDGKHVIISPFGDVVPWDDFIEFINVLVTEFADSDINFPFKFEEVKQVTETTGGTLVEVEKTEKVR